MTYSPPVIVGPDDFSIPEGVEGTDITWIATSALPREYTILRDGLTIHGWEVWESGVPISWFISSSLSLGVHNFTIIFSDQLGQWSVDTVFVTVTAAVSEFLSSTMLLLPILAILIPVIYLSKKRTKLMNI